MPESKTVCVKCPTWQVCNPALEAGQRENCRRDRPISVGLPQVFEHWEVFNVAGEQFATGDYHRGGDR